MAVNPVRRWAATAPVPVFPVVGGGARDAVRDLVLDRRVDLVLSPRHATVLLVAGWLPRALLDALLHVHDQLPHPRATVWWSSGPLREVGAVFPSLTTVGSEEDVGDVLTAVHREVLTGERPSEGHLLPAVPPAPWKGVGPYGQGGEGMMGGRPYGRPMAELGDDRDGLTLDRLPLTVGPFLPHLPPGLTIDLVLQGDVVQEAAARPSPFHAVPDDERVGGPVVREDPFRAARTRPVPVAALEVARARHHLRWLADLLRLLGSDGLARRVLRVARGAAPADAERVAALRRWLQRLRLLDPATAGVGVLGPEAAAAAQGPVARAAGVPADVRARHPAYRDLGFLPVIQRDGDARARLRQRLAEAEQSLNLADAAASSGATVEPGAPIEGPRGPLVPDGAPPGLPWEHVTALLEGLEWGDAITTLVSLDLDLEGPSARAARAAA